MRRSSLSAEQAGAVSPHPGEPVELWPDDAVEVGRVVGAWGVRGALKVLAYAAAPEGLFSTKRWYLAAPAESAGQVSSGIRYPLMLRITQAKTHGDGIVASVQDLDDRDVAERLAGARIHVPRSSFPTPGADEFYWVDLIGAQVVNREGCDLGQVLTLQDTGPHCVLCLSSQDSQGQQRMVPFVAAYVDDVDVAARRIRVDWPVDY